MVDLSDYVMMAELQEMMHITIPAHIKRKAITIAHTRFIHKDAFKMANFECLIAKCTDLKGYLPLQYFAKEVGISWKTLDHRIAFMRKSGLDVFTYKVMFNRVMIEVGHELILASQRYIPFYLRNFQTSDKYNVREMHRVGDITVGFY